MIHREHSGLEFEKKVQFIDSEKNPRFNFSSQNPNIECIFFELDMEK